MAATQTTRVITLDKETYANEGFDTRNDPLTLEPFQIGDKVHVCVRCGAASLDDSWQSAGSLCGCFANSERIDLRRQPQPTAAAPDSESKNYWPWAIGGLIALAVVVNQAGEDTPDASDYTAEDAAEAAAEAAMADEEAVIPEETFYLAHWANVREYATGECCYEGRLERGEAVTGRIVSGRNDTSSRWLRITQGRFAGRYVSIVNLSGNRPPSIDTSTEGDDFLVTNATARSSPSQSGAAVQQLDPGQRVTIVGTVQGDGGPYAEIALKAGGVAYVPLSAMGGSDGQGVSREVIVHNRCSVTINFTLNYKSNGRWVSIAGDNGAYWTFTPGESASLQHNSTNIRADSAEMYYARLGERYHNEINNRLQSGGFDYIYINGFRRDMIKVVPEFSQTGQYLINFC